MTNAIDGLKQARELVARGWTQYVYARDSAGCYITLYNKGACSFCMVGSLLRVSNHDRPLFRRMYNELFKHCGGVNVETFNDNPRRTKEAVLAVFDNAIKEFRK